MASTIGGAAVFTLLIVALFYLLPTIIALMRQHKDAPAIAAINILLGWSVVGWFVSFVWALADPSGRRGAQTVVINTTQSNIAPPPPPPLPPDWPPVAPRQPAVTATSVAQLPHAEDRDTAFWDGLKDKGNPDDLEEYLVRFPQGMFAGLARARLQRHGLIPSGGVAPTVEGPDLAAMPEPQPPCAPKRVQCVGCGSALEPDAHFCDDCGAAVAA